MTCRRATASASPSRRPDAALPIWPGDGITWRLWARPWRASALAVACAQRGVGGYGVPRVALVVRRRPFERLERPARRRARSAAAREAAYVAAADLVPGLDPAALSVVGDSDGPPRLHGAGDDLHLSLSHCGDLVAAAVGHA